VPKKCHVLFEWPLKAFYIFNACIGYIYKNA